MTLSLTTHLDAPPDRVWHLLWQPETLAHVAWPVLRFVPTEPLPRRWREGGVYEVKVRLGAVLPIGRQQIRVSSWMDGDERWLRDDGRGSLVRRWDHRVRVVPSSDGGTRYTDEIDVEAGALTPLVRVFAQLFYRHRQRRWRALVRRPPRDEALGAAGSSG
ncbi:MAG TPA: hypothetical protein RMH99_14545 [Sandaracinaceae bacterium LLY-WYZ-13_1]|nr:hypothetical protein [Sandaracinaceae bacterium LLY-WYZ-13_1]